MVLYFGGNGEEVSWALADKRWPREVTVVALNYRGYGTSEGKPSADHLNADALELFDLVAARGDVDRARIAVFGRSLGTAVATHVAAERPVARVILVSPYDSLAAVGQGHYPFLPVSLMLRHKFAPVDEAPRCRMPLLAIVAPADSIIRVAHSRALFDAWAGPKEWVEIRGADHNTLGASREYWAAVQQFLRKGDAMDDEVDYVSGKTRVFGIVGDPIEQVRSPEIITAEITRRGHDAVLVPCTCFPRTSTTCCRASCACAISAASCSPFRTRHAPRARRRARRAGRTLGVINALGACATAAGAATSSTGSVASKPFAGAAFRSRASA